MEICVFGLDRLYTAIIDLFGIAVTPTVQPMPGKK
jgi:hypothetical protein